MSTKTPHNDSYGLLLERYQSGSWQVVTEWRFETPVPETRSAGRLRSYLFEANSGLPSQTPAFRFRLPAGKSSGIKVFDPLVMCRYGSLP
jgi:hypothetical protein